MTLWIQMSDCTSRSVLEKTEAPSHSPSLTASLTIL